MGLRARARRMVRDAWRAPDRLMHAHRRATLLARLRESAPPRRILFVCHGNIIRSPFAEHLARAWLPPPLRGKIEFASAGFIGPGRPPPPEAIETALLWDIDLSSHRSRLLSVEELAYADLVLVVEPRQRRAVQRLGCPACRIALLGDLDPQPVASREIVDPFGRPGVVLLESYRRIVRCVDALLSVLAAAQRAPAGRHAGPPLRAALEPEHP
jgi:protein-tyrosine phosphatase